MFSTARAALRWHPLRRITVAPASAWARSDAVAPTWSRDVSAVQTVPAALAGSWMASPAASRTSLWRVIATRMQDRRRQVALRVERRKESLLDQARKLGTAGLAFHTAVWATTWASLYAALSLSEEARVLADYLPQGTAVAKDGSTLLLAYALTVLTSPARHALDLAVVPLLLRYAQGGSPPSAAAGRPAMIGRVDAMRALARRTLARVGPR